jgi:hypothetical protein
MGRLRTKHKHLPPHMHFRRDRYYYGTVTSFRIAVLPEDYAGQPTEETPLLRWTAVLDTDGVQQVIVSCAPSHGAEWVHQKVYSRWAKVIVILFIGEQKIGPTRMEVTNYGGTYDYAAGSSHNFTFTRRQ